MEESTKAGPNKDKKEEGSSPKHSPEPSAAANGGGGPGTKPIELSNVPKNHEVNAFKKLFFKLGEKLSTTKQTPFPNEYITTVSEIDVYRVAVIQVINTMTRLVQQNPLYNENIDRKTLEAPPGADPFEILQHKFSKYSEFSHNKKMIEQLSTTCKKWSNVHRNYQDNARKCFHGMRTFIKVDIEKIADEREKVMSLKQQYDYVKYELESNPQDTSLVNAVNKAREAYESGMRSVANLAKKMKDDQDNHRIELVRFLSEFRNYHYSIALELEKTAANLNKIDSFAVIQSRGMANNNRSPSTPK